MKEGGAKVLALALDAAEKDLLCGWAALGILPTFRHLLNDSPSVVTTSPPGVYPGAVWGSLITGTGPDHHGRYSTHQIRKGTYRLYGFMPNHFRRRPFWEELSAAGKRVAIVDVPKSPPCETLNGVMVREWGTHDFDLGFHAHPASLRRRILEDIGQDPVGPCDQRTLQTADQLRDFREALLTRIKKKTTLLLRLLAEERWDFFMAAFGESHCAGHQCWSVHDPSHPDHDPEIAQRVGDILREVYVALDRAIGDVLDAAGETERTFVLTSHGFGPHYNASHLLDDVLRRIEAAPPTQRPALAYRVLRDLWRQLPWAWRVRLGKAAHQVVDQFSEPLDQRRRFFAVPNNFVCGAIRINLAGREPQGLVQPGIEYDAVCAEIGRDLHALVNPETGRPAVLRVWATSEMYDGPLLDEMPDLIVEWDRSAPICTLESPKTGRIDKPYTGGRSGLEDGAAEGLAIARVDENVECTEYACQILFVAGQNHAGFQSTIANLLAQRRLVICRIVEDVPTDQGEVNVTSTLHDTLGRSNHIALPLPRLKPRHMPHQDGALGYPPTITQCQGFSGPAGARVGELLCSDAIMNDVHARMRREGSNGSVRDRDHGTTGGAQAARGPAPGEHVTYVPDIRDPQYSCGECSIDGAPHCIRINQANPLPARIANQAIHAAKQMTGSPRRVAQTLETDLVNRNAQATRHSFELPRGRGEKRQEASSSDRLQQKKQGPLRAAERCRVIQKEYLDHFEHEFRLSESPRKRGCVEFQLQ